MCSARRRRQRRKVCWKLVESFWPLINEVHEERETVKAMKPDKRRRLERAGWRVADTAEFLGLNAHEQRLIDLKLALAAGVRRLRERRGLTQAALAKQLGSSQSRVAKLEAGDRSVS